MTNNLKCPFCGAELEKEQGSERWWYCVNAKCVHKYTTTHETIWQALLQAKQDLEFFKEEQDMAITALIERTKKLDKCQKDLEIATKALESISGIRENIEDYYGGVSIHYQQMVLNMDEIATNALETIGKHKE